MLKYRKVPKVFLVYEKGVKIFTTSDYHEGKLIDEVRITVEVPYEEKTEDV